MYGMQESGIQDGRGVNVLEVGFERCGRSGFQSVGLVLAKIFISLKKRLEGCFIIIVKFIDSIHNGRVSFRMLGQGYTEGTNCFSGRQNSK